MALHLRHSELSTPASSLKMIKKIAIKELKVGTL